MIGTLRIHTNADNARVYMLSYDISANRINWFSVFSYLRKIGAVYLDMQHLFRIDGYGAQLYVARPVKSSWLFFSKMSIAEIDAALLTYAPDLKYSLSESNLQDGIVAAMNFDYDLQWNFDDKLDWMVAH